MTTRRRVLTILAGGALLPTLGTKTYASPAQWRGIALGADANIILAHPDARRLIAMAVAEIKRLEGIFSLYRDSQLVRLNRDGRLDEPAPELVELLSICAGLNERTKGAFDPTIQPLWALYAESYAVGMQPDKVQIKKRMEVCGWHHIQYSPERVEFDEPEVMLTLNGIAQSYIADRIAALFRTHGIDNVLINTGEILTLGKAPDGSDWQVRLGDSSGPSISLSNAAVATSAPLGTTFDDGARVGHIIDPRTGRPGGRWTRVSVTSSSATEADGLSTAFCLMDREKISAARGKAVVELA